MTSVNQKITVKVNGESTEYFMSFGLLNEIMRSVGDPDTIGQIIVNYDLRDNILGAVLSKRSKSGKIENKVGIEDVEIDPADVNRLLTWVTEHVVSFFIESMTQMKGVMEKHQGQMSSLMSSLAGQGSSASSTPSAGA